MRRLSLPRSLPVFESQDLAYRWGLSRAMVSKMEKQGRFMDRDVYSAAGRPLGWTWTAVAAMEATDPDLARRFQAHRESDVTVEEDDTS